ncbi:unnamed protein product [Rhizoctonia solani]|uniref:Uncharacterized protein n=1 Tax=Rhizoctonia solani TaxID=456999 RepID=A0A8H3DRT6_9AGAM|nr:unnamed protein product [Rhizoctonia solani]
MELSKGPHPIWGETLFDYPGLFVSRFYNEGYKAELGCTSDFKEQLQVVRNNPLEVTACFLEDVLRRSRTWDVYEEFTGQEPIIDLMDLLDYYCDNHKMFSHYYGFLCIQLLTTVMYAGILDAPGRHCFRDKILSDISKQHDNSYHMADFGSGILWVAMQDPSEDMYRSMLVEAGDDTDGRSYLFQNLGGFDSQDALFILEGLWTDRKAFMILCDAIGDEMPGWSILLIAIWHHIRGLDDPNMLLKRLRNLLLRYALIVPDMEFSLVIAIAEKIEAVVPGAEDHANELPPVDADDCRNMLRAFKKYLNSTRACQDPGHIMSAPFSLVYRNTLLLLPDEVPPLIGAVIERVWKILADDTSSMKSRIITSFGYALNAMWAMCLVIHVRDQTRKQRRAAAVAWTELMRDVHFIELMGRLCSVLVLSTGEGGREFLITSEQLKEFTECVDDLMEVLKEIADGWDVGQLEDLHQTWDRVFRYIDLQLILLPQTKSERHSSSSPIVWMDYVDPIACANGVAGSITVLSVASLYTGVITSQERIGAIVLVMSTKQFRSPSTSIYNIKLL